MRVLAILLIVAGLLALIYGGFSYVKHRDTADVGPVHISVQDRQRVDIPPVLGGLALAAGVVLLLTGSRPRQA